MARPRQLLIIVTCGNSWNDPSSKYYAVNVKPMNEAVKQNLVRKIGDTRPVSFGTKPQNPKLTNPKQFWAKLLDPKPKN